MAITNDVNVGLLNECFELAPFHGLCKPHPNDTLKLQEVKEDTQTVNNLNEDSPEHKTSNESGKFSFFSIRSYD